MFFQDSRGLLQCEALAELGWLDHGFSTRHSAGWLEAAPLASVRQVHGNTVVAVEKAGVQGDADGLISIQAGLYVAVRTADCFPIVLADSVTGAVAAVHSGWRGTAGMISMRAVQRMGEMYRSQPENLHAAIGPGIGACCYEVGAEVAQQFGLQVSERGSVKLDLAGHLAKQLEQAGLPRCHIYTAAPFCTLCRPDLFWSYRRDKDQAGRMWSGIAIARA